MITRFRRHTLSLLIIASACGLTNGDTHPPNAPWPRPMWLLYKLRSSNRTSLAFVALLAVWLSLQASTSLQSLPSASSEGHRDHCTQQGTEYCDAYPMDKEPIQDTSADVDMESQTESQDERMDTGEGPVKDGGKQNQEKEGDEKVGGEEERGGEKDEGGKGDGKEKEERVGRR
ncbi:hypothetical protein GBAR_LOCUS8532 [Geodia barretti]|uniref:Uncharacterized protein n=1 Tax=Geodia barretti TaxID=519541 RepID=A0AA35WAJ4_GEOBA|nr:hypothetical protein GBAR_LOCUS8532 [Geodia barretti]